MNALFIHDGHSVDYTPALDVPGGTVVVVGSLVGVTKRPLPSGMLGALAVTGIYDVAKATGVAILAGTRLYWDSVNQRATPDDGGGANPYAGISVADAAAPDTTVRIRLNH